MQHVSQQTREDNPVANNDLERIKNVTHQVRGSRYIWGRQAN